MENTHKRYTDNLRPVKTETQNLIIWRKEQRNEAYIIPLSHTLYVTLMAGQGSSLANTVEGTQ